MGGEYIMDNYDPYNFSTEEEYNEFWAREENRAERAVPEETITLEVLSKRSKVSISSLRNYLGHYTLTKFQYGKNIWELSDEFIKALVVYLLVRKRQSNARALEKWWYNRLYRESKKNEKTV